MWTEEYEEQVIRYIISSSDRFYSFKEKLLPEYLSPFGGNILRLIYNTFDLCGELPSLSTLTQELNSWISNNPSESPLIKKYIKSLQRIILLPPPVDIATTERNLILFLKKAAVRNLLYDLPDMIDKDEVLEEVRDRVEIISMIEEGIEDSGTMFYTTCNEWTPKYIEHYTQKVIPTGITNLDNVIRGGMYPGELGYIIGSTGVGKSICLLNIANACVSRGVGVVYYTLELSELDVHERFCSLTTGIPGEEIWTSYDKFVLPQLIEQRKMLTENKELFMIKEFPSGTTMEQMEAHFRMHSKKLYKPALVVFDYAEEIGCKRHYTEYRREALFVTRQMISFGKRNEVAVWSACQANRKALSKETLTLEEINEAYSRAFPAHLIITICQTKNEESGGSGGRFRYFVAKNRKGKKYIYIPMKFQHPAYRVVDDLDAQVAAHKNIILDKGDRLEEFVKKYKLGKGDKKHKTFKKEVYSK